MRCGRCAARCGLRRPRCSVSADTGSDEDPTEPPMSTELAASNADSEVGTKDVMLRLDELSARLDQLSAIVMAQQTGALQPPGRSMTPVEGADGTADILSRLDEADRLRAQSREKMMEQMEKIATRMDWRLQRLEAASVPVGAGVDGS